MAYAVARGNPGHPHFITIDLGKNEKFIGFAYLPRKGTSAGTIQQYEFFVSDGGKNWGQPVSKGTFFPLTVLEHLKPLNANTNPWDGFTRYHFKVSGYNCFITAPLIPAPSNPWVWRAKFPGYHDDVDMILLRNGFHVAYIDVGAMLGSPKARNLWDAFYKYVTETASLSPIVALEAVSRGGLFAYNWAAQNPEKISCIYADTPVLDFKSWPGGKGTGMGSGGDWQNLKHQYGFTEEEAMATKDIPLYKLEPLAKAGIPILHVIGANDKVVPPAENTFILEKKYRALGGRVTVLINQGGPETAYGHHYPLDNPQRYANFIIDNTPLPPFADGTEWYQLRDGLRNSFIKFSREKKGRVQ